MAIISLKNSTLANAARGFAFQKTTGAVPPVPIPTFTSATTTSYTAAITGYDAQFTYTVSASVGSVVRTAGNVTVSGLSANQSSTLTVTAANTDATKGISFSSSVAFFSLPNVPILIQATQTADGGTITITNYDASATYTISATAGSVSRTGNTITLTGLSREQSSIVSVTASNSSGNQSANITASSEPLGEFENIATIVVPSGGLSTITFNNIPQGYQHLQIRIIARGVDNGSGGNERASLTCRFNSDSGSNYTYHSLIGNGSAASASGLTSQTAAYPGFYATNSAGASEFAATIIDILDYTSISKNKTMRVFSGHDGNGDGQVTIFSDAWLSTSSVTTILFYPTGNFAQYTTASLYGIKAP